MRTAALLPLLLALGAPARGDDLAARAARSYDVELRVPAAVAGAPGAAAVAIRCAPGVHLQRQAPLRVTASASPGITLGKARFGWGDVQVTGDAQHVEIPVSFTATSPGAAEIRLSLDFFVCSPTWCVQQERDVLVPVAVGAPAAQAVPPPGAR